MKYHQSGSKIKKLATICLLITVLLQSSLQEELKRVQEFSITKIEKASVDTSKPLTPQLNTIRVRNETKYTGTLRSSWSPDTLRVEIYHREADRAPIKSSRIITVDFPFNMNDTYQNQSLIYSTMPGQSTKDLRLNSSNITHYLIDQEFYIFSGEVIDSGYLLKNIHTYIYLKEIAGSESTTYHPLMDYFELYFEDDSYVFHILINNSMYKTYEIKEGRVLLIMFIGVPVCLMIPNGICILSHDFLHGKGSPKLTMTFSASQLHPLNLALSGFILLKFCNKLEDYFIMILQILLILISRCLGIVAQLLGIYETKKTEKTISYLTILSIAHLVWLVILIFNLRFAFYGCWFYSVLVIIDLAFLRESAMMRSKPAWQAWGVVMAQIVLDQASIYLVYFYRFWKVHTSAPPIFTEFVLPGFLALVFMLILFHWRFRLSNGSRKKVVKVQERRKNSGEERIDERVAPAITSFEPIDQVFLEQGAENYSIY